MSVFCDDGRVTTALVEGETGRMRGRDRREKMEKKRSRFIWGVHRLERAVFNFNGVVPTRT